MVEASWCRREH